MTKKEYCAPELEIVVLEQEDIITASSFPSSQKPVVGTTGNRGEWDNNWS